MTIAFLNRNSNDANKTKEKNMKKTKKLSTLILGLTFVVSASAANPTGSAAQDGAGATDSKSERSVFDQSQGTNQDVELTRTIREELGKDDSLSSSAKNVEIISLDNSITLRGTVQSQNEKDQILNHARSVAGTRSIKDEIKVNTIDSTIR
jgi:osmotically-inducible protein OsmY